MSFLVVHRAVSCLSLLLFLLFVTFVSSAARSADVSSSMGNRVVSRLREQRLREALTAAAAASSNNQTQQELEDALWFLVEFMPESDLETLPVAILVSTVTLALTARATFPWGNDAPWPIFLNDVLPYATMTEPRDAWRPMFYNYFSQQDALKQITSVNAAIEWMNQNAWSIVQPPIVFNASGDPTGLNEYSPFQVMHAHYASCTGLAIFLVSSLRSIGIPARVAGTPHWNLGNKTCPDGDASPDCGNHDWVEVWTNGGWSFVDQRGDLQLNTSWFFPGNTEHQVPNTLNHSIFATSYAPSSWVTSQWSGDNDTLATIVPYFPLVWDWSNTQVPAWDVTLRYLSLV